ncbi:hypothetical protein GY14_02450 [Delftia tsuruhatensis]|nr:hypothetical protein GY14_02450 [Delftia tsuruhatensis]
MVGQVHDHAHVVLHHEHGHAPFGAHVQDEARHVLGLLAVHAGHGLVQHQDARLHGQGARHLHALLQPVGQGGHGRMADVVYLQEIDDALLDVAAQLGLFAASAAQVEQGIEHVGAQVGVAAQLDVVQHRHAPEQRNVLEAAPQAQPGAARRRHARDVLALEADGAARGPVKARDGVEQRRLARAVGTDHRRDRAGLHIEAHARQRLHAAKGERDAIDLQQGGGPAAVGVCLHGCLVRWFVEPGRSLLMRRLFTLE